MFSRHKNQKKKSAPVSAHAATIELASITVETELDSIKKRAANDQEYHDMRMRFLMEEHTAAMKVIKLKHLLAEAELTKDRVLLVDEDGEVVGSAPHMEE